MIDIYKKIWKILDSREKNRVFILVFLTLITSIIEVVGVGSILPFLSVLGEPNTIFENKYLFFVYQYFQFNSTQYFLTFLGLVTLAFVIVSTLLKILSTYAVQRFGNLRRHSIGKKLLVKYLEQPYSFFINKNSSTISKNILSEVDNLINFAILPACQLPIYVLIAILLSTMMVLVDPELAFIIIIVFGGFYVAIYFLIKKIVTKLGEDSQRLNAERYKIVSEIIGGIKDVKILGKEKVYLDSYEDPSLGYSKKTSMNLSIAQIPPVSVDIIAFGAILAISIIALNSELSNMGELIPKLGLYAFGILRLKPVVGIIFTLLSEMRYGNASLNTIMSELQVENKETPKIKQLENKMILKNQIVLHNVSFGYEGGNKKVIDKINLSINVNAMVGVIGTTGAGKSTLIDIILGLLIPSDGEIKIDDVVLTNDNLRDWQNSIGYVPQSIFLLDDTIINNIAFGTHPEKINFNKIKEVAKISQIDDFIESLDQKYETHVGERGVRLSGGQRQRIGIARSLYHDPELIILDEATSALDDKTEATLMNAIHQIKGNKTIIMIAHRLSTLKKCDMVVELDGGKIVGVGTYNELKVKNLD